MQGTVMGRVLVVDDDPLVRNALCRDFRNRGFETDSAATLDEALAAANENAPDLAVVDLRLERESGLDVLERLRKDQPEVPVVMLTAYGSMPIAVEAMRLGAVNFVSKPLSAEKILEAARPAMQSSRSLARAEWEHIHRTLQACDGNVSEAARILGIHRRSLQRKLRKRPPG